MKPKTTKAILELANAVQDLWDTDAISDVSNIATGDVWFDPAIH